jgi:hypothetical protein
LTFFKDKLPVCGDTSLFLVAMDPGANRVYNIDQKYFVTTLFLGVCGLFLCPPPARAGLRPYESVGTPLLAVLIRPRSCWKPVRPSAERTMDFKPLSVQIG